jgi:hypothetical protein
MAVVVFAMLVVVCVMVLETCVMVMGVRSIFVILGVMFVDVFVISVVV